MSNMHENNLPKLGGETERRRRKSWRGRAREEVGEKVEEERDVKERERKK
jgi:hypothetical protein